jgi:hypothetical protein
MAEERKYANRATEEFCRGVRALFEECETCEECTQLFQPSYPPYGVLTATGWRHANGECESGENSRGVV